MLSRRLHALLLAALTTAYFGPLIYAVSSYPSGYDWRHTVISNLANPHDNPRSWRVAADGIAFSGVLLAVAGAEVRRVLRPLAPRWTLLASTFFLLGGTLLTVSALVNPGHYALLGLGKAHAKIARVASIALTLGMACNVPALLRLPAQLGAARAAAIFISAGPMTLFLLCRLLIPVLESHASPVWRAALHDSLPGSLAFWEWIGSATVFAFLAVVLLGAVNSASTASRT
ncbi:MAG TPA: hypothetical protein VHY09_02345 [Candidatus Methylacidiphilales bacterium]|jgi:hypothetical protein|nr:hypothetical protein [Candidatus Methylacidiphilales bacterium]